MTSCVLLEEYNERGFLKLIINRPQKRNAINYEVMDQLDSALLAAEKNDSVKVLIITGSGDQAFCSGGDLGEFHSLYTEEEALVMLSKMGKILFKLATFPKPTIALLNGTAVGGGCEIAAACDFRLARAGGKLGFIQGSLGIITGWGGASLLYEKLAYQSALKLLLSASVFSVEVAHELGFVDEIIDKAGMDVDSFLRSFISNESGVTMAYKRILVDKWKRNGLEERMLNEVKMCAKLWESEAHHKAVAKFTDKSLKKN